VLLRAQMEQSMGVSQKEDMRFYGRRKGRPLSQNMQRLLDELLPIYRLPSDPSADIYAEIKDQQATAKSLQTARPVILEIGFGGGEHLAALAAAHPESLFIGAEPFVNGVASLLRHIESQNLQNIYIWPDDVRLILEFLPAASLSCIYVMFPDPWPKNRHAGRRIVNQTMLDNFAYLLADDGILRMASDHPIAKTWLLAETVRHPAFCWTAQCAEDWRQRPVDWPQTRYMKKGVTEGRPASWFQFHKIA
jgi:tRNA (guanine-N7-)-methyltransferase